MSEVESSARAHVHTPLPYLANGWADCVQTWCVANDPLDERLTQVRCGVHLHVRTCTPPSNDGASSPARPSPIKASYWSVLFSNCYKRWLITDPINSLLQNLSKQPLIQAVRAVRMYYLLYKFEITGFINQQPWTQDTAAELTLNSPTGKQNLRPSKTMSQIKEILAGLGLAMGSESFIKTTKHNKSLASCCHSETGWRVNFTQLMNAGIKWHEEWVTDLYDRYVPFASICCLIMARGRKLIQEIVHLHHGIFNWDLVARGEKRWNCFLYGWTRPQPENGGRLLSRTSDYAD